MEKLDLFRLSGFDCTASCNNRDGNVIDFRSVCVRGEGAEKGERRGGRTSAGSQKLEITRRKRGGVGEGEGGREPTYSR